MLPLLLAMGWGKTIFSWQNGGMVLAGIGIGLFLMEIGIEGIGMVYAHILEVIGIVVISYCLLRQQAISNIAWILFIIVAIHTLGWGTELSTGIDRTEQLLWVTFISELVIRVLQSGLIFLLLAILWFSKKKVYHGKGILYTTGVFSVAFLCWSYTTGMDQEHLTQKRMTSDILVAADRVIKPQKSRGILKMTQPIMVYYAVEPHEVRAEILVNARTAVRLLGIDDRGKGSIPVESQKTLKDYMLARFLDENPLRIEDRLATPVASSINFVTLTPAGVILRESPRNESLDHGILGITLIYESTGLADRLDIDWTVYESPTTEVELSITDLFGISTRILTPDETSFSWQSRLPGYQIPQIREIEVQTPEYSSLSILFFILAFILMAVARPAHSVRRRILPYLLLAISGLCYPLLRNEVRLPFLEIVSSGDAETELLMEDLLSNVYRAFDVRDESAVYDRLAVSVTGQQLNRIYLENRRSMELEERGGARANVDEVVINEVSNIVEDGGIYTADVGWKVGGSVSHFGHTHYRQNNYVAKVSFRIVEDSWKITDIELLDEERIL